MAGMSRDPRLGTFPWPPQELKPGLLHSRKPAFGDVSLCQLRHYRLSVLATMKDKNVV